MINWNFLRKKRDHLLLISDWTQLSDNTLTDEQKIEWRAYREALRQMPQTHLSATDKTQIVWPTKPS